MKALLISIRPQWVEKILNGIKKDEIRKGTALYKAINKLIAEQGVAPMFIYCTKDNKGYLVEEKPYKDYSKIEYEMETKKEIEGVNQQRILNGKVVAQFNATAEEIRPFFHWCEELQKRTCLTRDEELDYLDSKDKAVGNPKRQGKVCDIHINSLEIFDKPKELSEFKSYKKNIVNTKINGMIFETELDNSLTKAPQSYCFIEI